MGELMSLNGGRLLGHYDELSSFLARLNLFKGKDLSNSHEMSQFLDKYAFTIVVTYSILSLFSWRGS